MWKGKGPASGNCASVGCRDYAEPERLQLPIIGFVRIVDINLKCDGRQEHKNLDETDGIWLEILGLSSDAGEKFFH